MELIKSQTHIDFMGKFKIAMMLSIALILGGIASIAMHGGLKYGIDFEGGTLVQLKFAEAPAIDTIRSSLKDIGLADSTIQEFGSPDTILIRVERTDGELKEMGSRIKAVLEEKNGFTGIII